MKNATLPHAKQPSYVTPQHRVTFVNKLADLVATSSEKMWFFYADIGKYAEQTLKFSIKEADIGFIATHLIKP